MMKKFFATMICICTLFALSACGASNAKQNETTTAPLTYVRPADNINLYEDNFVETEEGVTIICTSNYVLGPEANGQFLFCLKEEWSEECLEDDYDWNIKFISNGHIYQTDFFDYDGNLIATEECNGAVTVDLKYKESDTYIDKVVLYVEYENKMFTAEFVRSGS